MVVASDGGPASSSLLARRLLANSHLLERELLNGISDGCVEFFEHYCDQKTGYGLWTPRWGGNDGPDDGAENAGARSRE